MHLVHMLPAINWQGWARDESSIVRGQKHHATSNFTGLAQAADWDSRVLVVSVEEKVVKQTIKCGTDIGRFRCRLLQIKEFAETYTIIGTTLELLQSVDSGMGWFTSGKVGLRIPP